MTAEVFDPVDDPDFLDALATALYRTERRDNPELMLMADGPDIAAGKAYRILTELRAELARRAGAR